MNGVRLGEKAGGVKERDIGQHVSLTTAGSLPRLGGVLGAPIKYLITEAHPG